MGLTHVDLALDLRFMRVAVTIFRYCLTELTAMSALTDLFSEL